MTPSRLRNELSERSSNPVALIFNSTCPVLFAPFVHLGYLPPYGHFQAKELADLNGGIFRDNQPTRGMARRCAGEKRRILAASHSHFAMCHFEIDNPILNCKTAATFFSFFGGRIAG